MSTLRTRFGIPGLISTIALVFAMTGGAFAAKYLITSTKQISPSVLKKLKGATGPAGAAGAQGPAGAAGANGEKGANGTNGAPGEKGEKGEKGAAGTNGKSVKVTKIDPELPGCDELGGALVKEEGAAEGVEVCNGAPGEKGEKGDEGDPWTAGGTLPSGETLTGVWSFRGAGQQRAPFSFAIRLASSVEEGNSHYGKSGEGEFTPTGACPGGAVNPQPKPGHLCVYEMELSEATFISISGPGGGETPSRIGGVVRFEGESVTAIGEGVWAVTAE